MTRVLNLDTAEEDVRKNLARRIAFPPDGIVYAERAPQIANEDQYGRFRYHKRLS